MRSVVVLGLSLCLSTAHAETQAPSVASVGAQTSPPSVVKKFAIIGTTDVHGRLRSLPMFSSYMKAIRAKQAALLVDAGDVMQGTLESDLDEGATMINAYKATGYDAVAIGNHEFDYGPAGPPPTPRSKADDPRGALKARAKQASGAFPFLAANLRINDQLPKWDNFQPSLLKTIDGVSVGIIGVATTSTPYTTIRANVYDVSMEKLEVTIAREAKKLRKKGAKIVVVSAHAGGACKDLTHNTDVSTCDPSAEVMHIAKALEPGLVDVIVAGHTHQAMAHEVSGIAIVQAWAMGNGFSRVDLELDANQKVTKRTIQPPHKMVLGEQYEEQVISEDAAVAEVIAPALARADAVRAEKLGPTLPASLPTSYDSESPLGNFIADQMREVAPGNEVAVTNGGGIRASLPAGELTFGALYEVLPFQNELVRLQMRAGHLRELVASNLKSKGGVYSLSGVSVVAECVGSDLKVKLLDQKGEVIPDDKLLKLVTTDFLATGGDGFRRGREGKLDFVGLGLRDGIAGKLRGTKQVLQASDWYDKSKLRLVWPEGKKRPLSCSN